jgi:hypothetical protein
MVIFIAADHRFSLARSVRSYTRRTLCVRSRRRRNILIQRAALYLIGFLRIGSPLPY